MSRIGDWMQTRSGVAYYPADPRTKDVNIEDIAASLSKLCRFGGHCKRFYSVAEHSVLVSLVVPPEHALQALLHDATEAYVVDMPRPAKKALGKAYADLEQLSWEAVCARFGIPLEMHPSVKAADNNVLLAEKVALLGPSPAPWSVPGTPADVRIWGHWPWLARWRFLRRFKELTRV